uniref:CB1 cannabinoid receptor-interacting protein 1 n=1 Tax=Electrophorus electricus TaxID=8005 RepID=A0A4W4F332_ELEEL
MERHLTRAEELLTEIKYRIDVVIKPAMVLAIVHILMVQSKDPTSVIYSGAYETEGVAHTKREERQPVQVSIQISRCRNSFCSIEYECKPNETCSLMSINKELFL